MSNKRRRERLKGIAMMPEISADLMATMGPEFEASWREAQAKLTELGELLDAEEAEEAAE